MERWGGSGAGSVVAFIATLVVSPILRFPSPCLCQITLLYISHDHMGRAV